ncbi:MAG TPA: DUF1816 domain-containing protein [Coleofasciculaceae cyanobacterium]|jgi:hypothetical protein
MLVEIADRLKTVASSIIGKNNSLPYWIEVTTMQPHCIYYFGPFDNYREAKRSQGGYIEDLIEEKANGISVKIQRCLPTNLTITEEEFLAG